MATIEGAVRSYMISKTSITDLIGERIRPVALLESETYPAVTYICTIMDDDTVRTEKALFNFNVWVKSEPGHVGYVEGAAIATAIKRAFHDGRSKYTLDNINIIGNKEPIIYPAIYEDELGMVNFPIDIEVLYYDSNGV